MSWYGIHFNHCRLSDLILLYCVSLKLAITHNA